MATILQIGCVDVEDEVPLGAYEAEIAGGTVVPVGQLEAVGRISGCSATLVSDTLVLTATHCLCADFHPFTCGPSNVVFTLRDVRPVSNPSIRQNIDILGVAISHPDFSIGHWLANDVTAIRLSQPASSLALVTPIPFSTAFPVDDSNVTLVGFGPDDAPGGHCNGTSNVKRKATTPLDFITFGPGVNDMTLSTVDIAIHVCPGDSGGPMLDTGGNVIGVASHGNNLNSSAYNGFFTRPEWLSLQSTSPGNRVAVWDAAGATALTAAYDDFKPDTHAGLLGWLDAGDFRVTGDFMDQGHDQILHVNRGGSGGRIMITDYADGEAPTEALFLTDYPNSTLFDGWLDANDAHLVGDFLDRGHDQLLLINRSGSGGRLMIIDFASGSPSVGYLELYGQFVHLAGWHDPEDGLLAGNFFGDGHDQVMFVNRAGSGGRILIADFSAGVGPAAWRYIEYYSQGNLLNGWHDTEDLMLAGDFRTLGRDQVLFLNRGPGNGRVLITDFGDGAQPAEWEYYEAYGQSTVLDGMHDSSDVVLAGDFSGAGHDRVLFVNRTTSIFATRAKVVDFSDGSVPGEVALSHSGFGSALTPRISFDDELLAGDLRGLGRPQLVTLERF